MTKGRSNSWLAIMPTLLLPVFLGLSVYFVLVGAIDRKLIDDELITRYITGHPVSKVTTAMFLVGMAALLLAASEVMDQFRSLSRISLHENKRNKRQRIRSKRHMAIEAAQRDSAAEANQDLQAAPSSSGSIPDLASLDVRQRVQLLQERLFKIPNRLHKFYLWQRLSAALVYISQNKSAGGLSDELKYIADTDGDRKHERYSLVRILIWATPMLGFLGTVLGISEALGGIAVGPDNDFQSMMSGLQSSLYIAFDTTALALTLSIILMFGQFVSDRFETQLLIAVDDQTRNQVNQFFTIELEKEDEHLRAIRGLGQELLTSTGNLVQQQCDLWNRSILSAQEAWITSLDEAKSTAQDQITEALSASTRMLANEVTQSISKADKTLDHRIKQWQTSLSQLARSLEQQHEKISGETELVVDAALQFKGIEGLQENLLEFVKALPDSQNFNESTGKLAESVQLLESQVTQLVEFQKHQAEQLKAQNERLLAEAAAEEEKQLLILDQFKSRKIEESELVVENDDSSEVDHSSMELEPTIAWKKPTSVQIVNEQTLEQHIAEQQIISQRLISLDQLRIVLPDSDHHDQKRAA